MGLFNTDLGSRYHVSFYHLLHFTVASSVTLHVQRVILANHIASDHVIQCHVFDSDLFKDGGLAL